MKTGECKVKCDEGKSRNSNGDCEPPSCSLLNDCSTNGICLFTSSSLISFPTPYCNCDERYEGNDCSQLSNCGVLMDIVLLIHLIILNVNVILVGMELIVIIQSLIFHQNQIQFLVDLQLKLLFLLHFQFPKKI